MGRCSLLSSLLVCAAVTAVSCLEPVTELRHTYDFVVGPEGGRFELDGGVTLVFPVGAVPEPISVKATRFSPTPFVPGTPLGDAWLFEPEGAAFSLPIQVSLPTNRSQPQGARVRVARAPDKSRIFELLFPTQTVNALRVTTSHFSVLVPVAISADGGVPESDAGFSGEDAG